nr:hypothetical protein [Acrocarpospora pleiomorpha]
MVKRPRDTEVNDHRSLRTHDDIARLEIPMHDPGPMNSGQRGRGSHGKPLEPSARARPLLPYDMMQRRPGHEFADNERLIVMDAHIQNPGRAERRHPPREFHFPEESAARTIVLRKRRMQYLDRDLDPRRRDGPMDFALPAAPDPAGQPIVTQVTGFGTGQEPPLQ